MKHLLIIILFGVASLGAAQELKPITPAEKHSSEAYVVTQLLLNGHYKKVTFNDSLSSIIYDNFFDRIDPNRIYFLEADVDKFKFYRHELDDQIPNGKLEFAYDAFDIYRKRSLEQIEFVLELLDNGFDFEKEENYDFDRKKSTWAATKSEQNEIWRKTIKNLAINYLISQDDNDWDKVAEKIRKRYLRLQKAVHQYKSSDVFQVYMNSFADAFDPHTNYFSPFDAEDFKMDMNLSFEGIGARLTQNLDYTEISSIIDGGPAYRSNDLHKDDKIVGVAQGDEEFDDVVGWRLDEVVQKIRGPKGTIVRLLVIRKDVNVNTIPDTVTLERDKITLERQAAKGEIIPIDYNEKEYRLGVITLPSFYLNFDERNKGSDDYRSATKDVMKIITELKEEGMDALMMDLRFNGGGSLQEAIDMTGLFIPQGPVVQVRNSNAAINRYEDEDDGQVFYDGPLAVLMNRGSASASEIFSAAIKDYKRGVLLGESTFGKGTVQNIISLKKYIKNPEFDVGQLKMTIAKFYGVNGSSNQQVGVAPNISFPSYFSKEEYGEGKRKNALPWDEINSAKFMPTDNVSEELLDFLNELYLSDLKSDPDIIKLVKSIEKSKENKDRKSVSLNLQARRVELKKDAPDDEEDDTETLEVDVESSEVEEVTEAQEKLKDDPLLKEGLRLLAALTKHQAR